MTLARSVLDRAILARPFVIFSFFLAAWFNWNFLSESGAASWMIDFDVIRRAVAAGASHAYDDHALPFIYPPTALSLFWATGAVPREVAHLVWAVASGGLYWFAAARLVGRKIALFSLFSVPFVGAFVLGQVAILLGAGLLLAFSLGGRAGGVIIGLVACVKPQMVVLAPLILLLRRDWGMIAAAAAAAAATALVTLMIWGVQPWYDWLEALRSFDQAVIDDGSMGRVISPAGQAVHLGLPAIPIWLAGASLALFVAICFADRLKGANLVALVVMSSLMVAPYSRLADLIAAMPAVAAILWRSKSVWALVTIVIYAGSPVLTMSGVLAWFGRGLWLPLRNIVARSLARH